MRAIIALAAIGLAGYLVSAAQAQTDPTRESTPATPLSTTLGLVVVPAKKQTRDQQATDETECYAWSKQQTGVDPFAAPTAAQPQEATADHKAIFNKGFTECLEPRGYTVK